MKLNKVERGQVLRKRQFYIVVVVLGLTFGLIRCGDKGGDPAPPPPPTTNEGEIGKAKVWVTAGDQSKLLTKETDISITAVGASENPSITIDTTQKLQEIEGFGAALTGSSAYLINDKMNNTQRNALLQTLFNAETGIGISYLRMTIGASDFSLSDYTYDDMPTGQTDNSLSNFSIANDADVVAVFKQILTISPSLKIMGSPWSPPAWMKTNGSLKGGKLSTSAYDAYARYFVKYIQAYKNEGITIDAITPQNEPLHFTANYPCMEMTAQEQIDFIKNNLGPTFASEGITTKIIAWDHNWDNANYAITVLNDPVAKSYVAGSAFHGYGGTFSQMGPVHTAHPDKGLYFTEVSGGAWASNFSENLQWNASNILLGTLQNWSKTVLFWNLALDQNYGPTNNGCTNCRGVVTINSTTGATTKNVEYYLIGHFSKFVRPGAHRVASTGSNPNHVAFINTDGSKVLVVLNSANTDQTFTVTQGTKKFSYSIKALSLASIVWN